MDIFFTFLKKSLVATIFVMFAFVATYIPQPWNDIKQAEAGGVGNALEVTQIANNVQLGAVNVATSISAAAAPVISWATSNLWTKEFLLDGIGWAIAKQIVSSMVQSLIDWINSGFQGSPAFVQDLQGFLLNAADEALGTYIQGLGSVGSFICSPFKLDVQISLATSYTVGRTGNPAPTCKLSGVFTNLESFINGSFESGGWADWFTLTSNPEQYTPYGSVLTAEAGARVRLLNAQGEELTLLGFGDGFLSGEICRDVTGPDGVNTEDCIISKPGKIIEEALSFNLDTGRQSLIQADEINEIIAALLGQLANTALTGVSGLLGLSTGTGYTYSGYDAGSYTQQVVADATVDEQTGRSVLVEARDTQEDFIYLIEIDPAYLPLMIAKNITDANANSRRAVIEIENTLNQATANRDELAVMIAEYDAPATTNARKSEIIQEFSSMRVYTRTDIGSITTGWDIILGTYEPDEDE